MKDKKGGKKKEWKMKKSGSEILFHSLFWGGQGEWKKWTTWRMFRVNDEQEKACGKERRKGRRKTTFIEKKIKNETKQNGRNERNKWKLSDGEAQG